MSMYKSLIMKAAAVAVAMTLGVAAQAATTFQIVTAPTPFTGSSSATVDADQFTLIQQSLIPGQGSVSFTVTASEPLTFTDILLQGAGANRGADLGKLDITYTAPDGVVTTAPFQSITAGTGNLFEARSIFSPPTFSVAAGEEIRFTVFERSGESIALGVSLDLLVTTAPVPLPAAGMLMLGLMAAGGVAAHRRSRKAATA